MSWFFFLFLFLFLHVCLLLSFFPLSLSLVFFGWVRFPMNMSMSSNFVVLVYFASTAITTSHEIAQSSSQQRKCAISVKRLPFFPIFKLTIKLLRTGWHANRANLRRLFAHCTHCNCPTIQALKTKTKVGRNDTCHHEEIVAITYKIQGFYGRQNVYRFASFSINKDPRVTIQS